MDKTSRAASQITVYKTLDACIGKKILIILKENLEIEGVLKGFDENLNVVLFDVIEYEWYHETSNDILILHSKKLNQMLINNSQILWVSL